MSTQPVRLAVSFAAGAVVGILAQALTITAGHGGVGVWIIVALGILGVAMGFSLITGVNLGSPLAIKMETPSQATPTHPFAGVCVLAFTLAVIICGVVMGGLLAD